MVQGDILRGEDGCGRWPVRAVARAWTQKRSQKEGRSASRRRTSEAGGRRAGPAVGSSGGTTYRLTQGRATLKLFKGHSLPRSGATSNMNHPGNRKMEAGREASAW